MVTVYHAYLGEKRRKKICTKEKGISKVLKLLFHFFLILTFMALKSYFNNSKEKIFI